MKYRENINVDELVTEYVRECEVKYDPSSSKKNEKSQKAYSESLDNMGEIDLGNITEGDVERIVKRYLCDWGGMRRVLGQKGFQDWRSELTRAIQSNHKTLKGFRSKDLINVELSEFKTDIERLYESFETIVGRIAATKVLHLVCPNFFPMWDNKIADGVRNGFPKKGDKGTRIKAFSAADYYRFIQAMQIFLREHQEALSSLACEYHNTKLRVLDECLFWATSRPFYLFSFRQW